MAYVAIQYADQQYPARSFSLLEKVKGKKGGEKKIGRERERERERERARVYTCVYERAHTGWQAGVRTRQQSLRRASLLQSMGCRPRIAPPRTPQACACRASSSRVMQSVTVKWVDVRVCEGESSARNAARHLPTPLPPRHSSRVGGWKMNRRVLLLTTRTPTTANQTNVLASLDR